MIELPNNSYSMVPIPSFVKIGKYSSIGDVIFHSLSEEHQVSVNNKCVYTTNWDQPQETGVIEIGNDCWIGNGVRILPNVKIGNGAIIGAGAVVAGEVAPYTIVVGNPSRIVRWRFEPEQIEILERIKWWDWSLETIMERKEDMKNVDLFISKYA